MKILIADDEIAYRKTLEIILKPFGDVHQSHNGADAVRRYREALFSDKPFDLVFLDIKMPQMDGQEALVAIRKLEREKYGRDNDAPRAVIIMATTMDDPHYVMDTFLRGNCDAYINKPVTKELVMEKLRMAHLLS
ncbi:MAG: response regulator [Magnetococcus sp. DMHC-6]